MPLSAPKESRGSSGSGGYSGGSIIATIKEESAWLEQIFGARLFGRPPSVSMGTGRLPLFIPRGGVSTIPTATAPGPQNTPTQPSVGQDTTQMQEVIQMVSETLIATSHEQYAKLKALYPNNPVELVISPIGTPGSTAADLPVLQPVIPSDILGQPAPDMPVGAQSLQGPLGGTDMDLGTLATDLLRQAGTAYIQRELGPQPVSYQTAQLPSFDLPFVDVIPQAPGAPTGHSCGGGSPVYKKVCGQYKWVYPKRRRRKQLVTQSDIKGLAALKGVVGQGKILETWIATHS